MLSPSRRRAAPRGGGSGSGHLVLPDIVVHRRGSDESNLLILEAKKKSEGGVPDPDDVDKLAAYRKTYGYAHTAFVTFDELTLWLDPDEGEPSEPTWSAEPDEGPRKGGRLDG